MNNKCTALTISTAISFLLISGLSSDLSGSDTNITRRFAIVIGANDGGIHRAKLRYASSDAKAVMNMLVRTGGVSDDDGMLVLDPDTREFINAMSTIKKKIHDSDASSKRTEIVFYYSGHSDEESILLGNDRVSYKEIKEMITDLQAHMRIVILDSCSSGAFTQIKGGTRHSPFLANSSYNMKGNAFITSSSSDEVSQESDRIRSSFFTHALLTGLRGAADTTGDGRVTLSEAYQYAYNETISDTEKTLNGPQHPNYAIEMSGTGDVVMTDIRKNSAFIIFNKDISGRVFIKDINDNLVCELRKATGKNAEVGLEDGSYTIVINRNGEIYESELKLTAGGKVELSQNCLHIATKEPTVTRGNNEKESDAPTEKFNVSLYPMFTAKKNVTFNYSLNLFGSYCAKLDGFSIGLGPGIVGEDVNGMQMNTFWNHAGGDVSGAQFSALVNIGNGDLSGVQFSSIYNQTKGNTAGIQSSGLVNYSGGDTVGLQAAGLVNVTGKTAHGLQISGLCNYAGDTTDGTQIAGLVNISHNDFTGLQLSGLGNYTGKSSTGVQIGGAYNVADGDINGLQLSGVFNYAKKVNGVQIGLINISEEQDGIPIGVFNFSKNGSIDVSLWGSSLTATNVGFTFRANYIYSMISCSGMNIKDRMTESLAIGYYAGVHLPVHPFYIDIDAGGMYVDNRKLFSQKEHTDRNVYQGRASAGYHITERFSIFAGGGISYIYDADSSAIKDGEFEPLIFAGIKYSLYYGK